MKYHLRKWQVHSLYLFKIETVQKSHKRQQFRKEMPQLRLTTNTNFNVGKFF